MARSNKNDRDTLYTRASQLAVDAVDIDQHADHLIRAQMLERGAAHREIARMMRVEAEACRRWADEPGDD